MLHLLDLQKTVLLFTSARSLCDSVHLFVCFEQNTLKSYKEILMKSLGNVDNEPKMMRFWCCSTFRRDCELWLTKYHRPMGSITNLPVLSNLVSTLPVHPLLGLSHTMWGHELLGGGVPSLFWFWFIFQLLCAGEDVWADRKDNVGYEWLSRSV